MEIRGCPRHHAAWCPSPGNILGSRNCCKLEEEDFLKKHEEGNLGEEICGEDVGWKQSEGRLMPSYVKYRFQSFSILSANRVTSGVWGINN
jgi:hypothetical protein